MLTLIRIKLVTVYKYALEFREKGVREKKFIS